MENIRQYKISQIKKTKKDNKIIILNFYLIHNLPLARFRFIGR